MPVSGEHILGNRQLKEQSEISRGKGYKFLYFWSYLLNKFYSKHKKLNLRPVISFLGPSLTDCRQEESLCAVPRPRVWPALIFRL